MPSPYKSSPYKLVPALFLLASPAFAGWSMTQVTTSRGGDEETRRTQRVWMDGAATKVEMVESDNPMMEPGSYLLLQDGGAKVFMVDPARKTYARFDPAAMGDSMAAMGGAFETSVEDAKVVKLLEEPGGQMLGHATTHYRFRTTYTLVMSMGMGMKTSTATDVTEDVWTAPDIAVAGPGQELAGIVGGGGGVPEQLRQLTQEVKGSLVGLPLKQVTVTQIKTSSKGSGVMGLLARHAGAGAASPGTDTTTLVVKDLVEAALPATLFQIPAGFAETEIMQRGPAMPDLGGAPMPDLGDGK